MKVIEEKVYFNRVIEEFSEVDSDEVVAVGGVCTTTGDFMK